MKNLLRALRTSIHYIPHMKYVVNAFKRSMTHYYLQELLQKTRKHTKFNEEFEKLVNEIVNYICDSETII